MQIIASENVPLFSKIKGKPYQWYSLSLTMESILCFDKRF